jgi:hypothetical protein
LEVSPDSSLPTGAAKLPKKFQNIKSPPGIGPNLEPRCPWANRCR